MDGIITSLVSTIGEASPILVTVFVGMYCIYKELQNEKAKQSKELEAVKEQLQQIRIELNKVATFYCENATCPNRKPKMGHYKSDSM